jgi:magnesium transporter
VASSDFRRTLSVILPRETPTHCIIMAFGNVRAVAGSKSVYILDAHKLPVKDFAQELAVVFRNCTNNGGFVPAEPCELIFLEEALRETVDTFQRRLRLFEPIVDRFLQRVANEVYSDTGVHQLVPLKDSLRSFQITTQQSLDCLTSLLNDDDSMLGLLLTEQEEAAQSGKPVDFTRHEHVEVLLGVYARQLYNINLEVQYLLGRLQSKQEFVALALASYRNRMVRMNVHISIVGLSMAIGTVMSSFFGMNLINGLESHPNAWYYVVTTSTLTGLFVSMISLNYLSGGTMRKRTAQRLEENETLAGALSDMSALDYTLKATLNRGERLTKDDFRRIWNKAARAHDRMPDQFNDGVVPAKEVDLLFEVFDNVKDGFIGEDDFHSNS